MAKLRIEYSYDAADGVRPKNAPTSVSVDVTSTSWTAIGTVPVGSANVPLVAICMAFGAAIDVDIASASEVTHAGAHVVEPDEEVSIANSAGDTIFARLSDLPVSTVQGLPATASPTLTSGTPAPLSMNARGALRVVPQAPDGTDIDPTAPTQTVPARSGTFTTAQVPVTTTPPAAPVLAALTSRKRARIKNTSAMAVAYVASAAAGATVAAGWPIAPGETYTVIDGYTGDLYAIGSAALNLAVEQLA